MYACLYRPPAPDAYDDQQSACGRAEPPGSPTRQPRWGGRSEASARGSLEPLRSANALVALAADFSPRYQRHRDDLVSIDVSGLGRLLGPARAIGEELRRAAAARGVRVRVALAGTRLAALVLVHARPGLTLVEPGEEAAALVPIPIGILEKIHDDQPQSSQSSQREQNSACSSSLLVGPHPHSRSLAPSRSLGPQALVSAFKRWGIRTLGELAALPPADLAARLGPQGLVWQAVARGEDVRPLVPDVPEERFESSIDLEWPIDGLEPLSFVLTRLLEPLSTRLERRDRGAAVLHVRLGLVTRDTCIRSLQLPSPLRDVRTLRTLALVDLESHPPPAAIDRVTLVIDPTPGRVLQHTLFTRAHPTPEQLSTLLARLGALMGQDRIGAPALVDSYRPGAFATMPFAVDHDQRSLEDSASSAASAVNVVSAFRRCRHPVPARVAVAGGRPVRVTTDRRGFVGGQVLTCAGPWWTSGEWWSACGQREAGGERLRPGRDPSARSAGGGAPAPMKMWGPASSQEWDRDEWDVALGDGAVYRIFRDRETDGWFIDAIVD